MLRFLILFSLFSIVLPAQTIIPHDTTVSGTWTKANSPYIIQGKVSIGSSQTLILEPGVELHFAAIPSPSLNYLFSYFYGSGLGMMEVHGILKAIGSETEPIIFTREDTTGYWGGVIIASKSPRRSIIKHCNFFYGNGLKNVQFAQYEDFAAVLGFYESEGLVANSNFSACYTGGIYAKRSNNLNIENCTISDFGGSGISLNRTEAEVRKCEIKAASNPSGSLVRAGLWAENSDVLLVNSLIHHLGSNGIYFKDNGGLILVRLRAFNNTIAHNAVGMRMFGVRSADFINCIFANNTLNFDPRASISIRMENCLTTSIEYDNRLDLVAGNIKNVDPDFIDGPNGNYRLYGSSPAVDVGYANATTLSLDSVDFYGQPRIQGLNIDIGAVEHQRYLSAEQVHSRFKLVVYPNPFESNLFISAGPDCSGSYQWSLYAYSGQKVDSGSFNASKNKPHVLALDHIGSGLYHLELLNDEGQRAYYQLRAR